MQLSAERHAGAPAGLAAAQPDVSAVELVEVCRRFGEVTAVAGVNLAVRRGEFFSLLGPSGCGKTTLLRLIAGLDLPDAGSVFINGREDTQTPAHRRPVNTVFQSYALFPHLNVRDNIAFGLRMKQVSAPEIKRRVTRVMEMAQISELAPRRPAQLSGGQKQRVALARAIINEPQVLLLDEPLGALDLKLRKQLQEELHRLQRRLGITFIYVTHDQEEALVMSDRIAVMKDGHLEQLGSVENVYERPRTRFVAQFLGSCNLLEATARRCAGRSVWAQMPFGEARVELDPTARAVQPGDACTFAVRPEKVRLLTASESGRPNCFPARVIDQVYTGAATQYQLETPGGSLNAWVLNSDAGPPNLGTGQHAFVEIPSAAFVLLDD